MPKSWIPKKSDIGRYFRHLTAVPDSFPFRPSDPTQVRPIYVLRFVCITAIVTLIPFGVLALLENNTSAGIMDLSLATLLIANYLHAQRYKRYTFNISLGVTLAAMLFVYMFLTMGMNKGGFVWYYAFPVVACFLLGSKKGAIATALMSLPMVAFFLIRTPPPIFSNYSLDFKLRFLSSFSVVFAFSYLFEYSREKHREKLQKAHDDLEKRFDERRRAEEALKTKTEELARSNRELEQFAYVASHDLQEPLRMVTSYMQLLARRYKGKLDSDADEFIHFATDGAVRMGKLINGLLAYSRVGTQGKELEAMDCETALRQSLDNLKVAIEENGALVTHDPLPIVMADNSQLIELFQNLIENAIKFHGDEPPSVHVSASRNGNGWIFAVCDNGIGIAPEYADRIFVIFQRLHSRREYAGTGIGLAICQKIVERHGGRIWVESGLEKGTTFYFTLPASKPELASS
jgi:signal transduction histidine kinase